MSETLYDTLIVTRAKQPANEGDLPQANAQGEGHNALCGDRVRLALRVVDGVIEDARHKTRGCAICIASADLMAEVVRRRSTDAALVMAREFTDMLAIPDRTDSTLPETLQAFLPLKTHKARQRCATLPWSVLEEALAHV